MPDNNINGFKAEIKNLSELIRDGRYDDIDLSALEKEAPDIAANFREIVDNLKMAGEKLNKDSSDFPIVYRHLDHISRTTEEGVMNVINLAEAMMNDCGTALDTVNRLASRFEDNDDIRDQVRHAGETINVIMDSCFAIITAVEFDDINRQLMVKLLNRLNRQSEDLSDILMSLNMYRPPEEIQSAFLEELKHIIDLDGSKRETQESIDELFEAF